MKPVKLFDIRQAVRFAGLSPDDHEPTLTGNGYYVIFKDELDSHRFTIGLTRVLGSLDAALEVYEHVWIEKGPGWTGVKLTLVGSFVGV